MQTRNAHGRLFLEVADDGIGIPDDKIQRRDSLGLSGMRERAQVLGGHLTISCKPGCGTIVSVNIPLRAASGGFAPGFAPPQKCKAGEYVASMFANEQSLSLA